VASVIISKNKLLFSASVFINLLFLAKILLLNKSNVKELCDYLFDLNINIKLEDL